MVRSPKNSLIVTWAFSEVLVDLSPRLRCWGRMPTTALAPVWALRAEPRAAVAANLSPDSSQVSSIPPPFSLMSTSKKFVGGSPMKSATNKLAGVS